MGLKRTSGYSLGRVLICEPIPVSLGQSYSSFRANWPGWSGAPPPTAGPYFQHCMDFLQWSVSILPSCYTIGLLKHPGQVYLA